jgi:hypothetical protein
LKPFILKENGDFGKIGAPKAVIIGNWLKIGEFY